MCEAAVTARMKLGKVKLRESGALLHGKRFSLRMKEKAYRSCVQAAMLHGSETSCLKRRETVILRTESNGEKNVWGVAV